MTDPTVVTTLFRPLPDFGQRLWALRAQWVSELPWGRYVFVATMILSMIAVATWVRIDVRQLRKDLSRNEIAQHDARLLNQRLHLEMDARRRAAALQVAASQGGFAAPAVVRPLHVQAGK